MFTSKLALVTLVAICTASASADPIKRNMPACTTEAYLDELTTYSAKGDKDGVSQLFVAGHCTMLRIGQSVSVISPGFMVATVRFNGTKLYTPSEALR